VKGLEWNCFFDEGIVLNQFISQVVRRSCLENPGHEWGYMLRLANIKAWLVNKTISAKLTQLKLHLAQINCTQINCNWFAIIRFGSD